MNPRKQSFVKFFISRIDEIAALTLKHLQITGLAVLFAIIIGVPVGILITRNKKVANIILAIANIFQTLPSLALFGLIIPVLGIGEIPAIFVLLLYALLPIIKNTYIGIMNVEPSLIDAGKGMGMTRGQILRMVQIPLAISVIMAGVRIATVINIGTATIAALIGAGGLGDMIFKGISSGSNNMILSGALPAATLALLVDWILGKVEYWVTPKGLR